MRKNQINDGELAKLLSRDRSVVTRYRQDKVTPPIDVIAKIHVLTNGAVSYGDFVSKDSAA